MISHYILIYEISPQRRKQWREIKWALGWELGSKYSGELLWAFYFISWALSPY